MAAALAIGPHTEERAQRQVRVQEGMTQGLQPKPLDQPRRQQQTWCLKTSSDADSVCARDELLDTNQCPIEPRYPVVCVVELSKGYMHRCACRTLPRVARITHFNAMDSATCT